MHWLLQIKNVARCYVINKWFKERSYLRGVSSFFSASVRAVVTFVLSTELKFIN